MAANSHAVLKDEQPVGLFITPWHSSCFSPVFSWYPTLFSPTCLPSPFVSLSLCLVSNSLCLSICPSLSVGCIDRLMIIKVWWRRPDSDSVFCCISIWNSHKDISASLALYSTLVFWVTGFKHWNGWIPRAHLAKCSQSFLNYRLGLECLGLILLECKAWI